jgi:hypothetical protein
VLEIPRLLFIELQGDAEFVDHGDADVAFSLHHELEERGRRDARLAAEISVGKMAGGGFLFIIIIGKKPAVVDIVEDTFHDATA